MSRDIPQIVHELTELLDKHREQAWSAALHQALAEYEVHPPEGRSRFLRMYAGMGSFNDLVLSTSLQTNDALDALRTELAEACRNGRAAGSD